MATWQHELVEPPTEPRARELWLQHAAGFIIFEDVRRYAMEQMDSTLPEDVHAAARKGIDDAVYGLMMVVDGVSGSLSNASHTVHIDFIARITARGKPEGDSVLSEIDLRNGDGMSMGYHGWVEGDFGEDPVAVPRSVEGE